MKIKDLIPYLEPDCSQYNIANARGIVYNYRGMSIIDPIDSLSSQNPLRRKAVEDLNKELYKIRINGKL
jgi:hypothetical protein